MVAFLDEALGGAVKVEHEVLVSDVLLGDQKGKRDLFPILAEEKIGAGFIILSG